MGKHRINSAKTAAKYGPRRKIIRPAAKHKLTVPKRDDTMTEEELLDFYLSKDDILIPKEVFAILDRRAAACLKANGIHIPESLKDIE